MNEWNGKLTRIQAIKIIESFTDQDDPFWENIVEEYYDEDSDTLPSIYHVFAAMGVTEQEYKDATGAENVNWPQLTHNAEPTASKREESYSDALRSLASYVGCGGYNADDPIDAKEFEEKIRLGIDLLLSAESQPCVRKPLSDDEPTRLETLERICDGVSQDMIDGGFTVKGLSAYAKSLEDKLRTKS